MPHSATVVSRVASSERTKQLLRVGSSTTKCPGDRLSSAPCRRPPKTTVEPRSFPMMSPQISLDSAPLLLRPLHIHLLHRVDRRPVIVSDVKAAIDDFVGQIRHYQPSKKVPHATRATELKLCRNLGGSPLPTIADVTFVNLVCIVIVAINATPALSPTKPQWRAAGSKYPWACAWP